VKRKKEFKNFWNWYIFIFTVICLEKIWKFLGHPFGDPQTIDLLTFYIVVLGLISGIIGWLGKRYLINRPFIIRFPDKGPYDSGKSNFYKKKVIEGVHGLFPDKFILRIKLRSKQNFDEINIRLVKKKYFIKPIFWRWIDAYEKNLIYIEKIVDLKTKHSPQVFGHLFWNRDDLRGGRDGYYKPTYSCPKGDYLWYAIKLCINPDIEKWKGYISFQHVRGGSQRVYCRGQIIIKNTKLELKECP